MTNDIFKEMEKAVQTARNSPHHTNKIGAVLFGTGRNSDPYSIARTNYWPESILENFGENHKVGNSSGTVHAETACILAASATENASICITDPFCPNCAKNMAEAGIKTIYIDQEGFAKDFARRREHHFTNMSMQICEKAGISVYSVDRTRQDITSILEVSDKYVPMMKTRSAGNRSKTPVTRIYYPSTT